MATDAIAAARLAVFAAFLPLSFFCLRNHGKTGFFGWLYVQIFCVLRVVTGGMGLHGSQSDETYLILNSIGLSPLILATAGVLHEARRASDPRLHRKLHIFLEIQFHAIVGTGMALIIVAVVNLMDGDSPSRNKALLNAGSALTCVAWALLALWAVFSLFKTKAASTPEAAQTMRGGKILLICVFCVLPLIALRLGYAVAFLQLEMSRSASSFITSKAVNVCLSVVPEMLVVAVLLGGGLLSRSLKRDLRDRDGGFAAASEDQAQAK